MARKKETRGGWNKKYKTEHQARKAAAKQRQASINRTMKVVTIRYHKINDADILEKLDQVDNKAGYIRALIRNDIERHKK